MGENEIKVLAAYEEFGDGRPVRELLAEYAERIYQIEKNIEAAPDDIVEGTVAERLAHVEDAVAQWQREKNSSFVVLPKSPLSPLVDAIKASPPTGNIDWPAHAKAVSASTATSTATRAARAGAAAMKKEVLDHGYLQLVETWGSDERIIEAARMSTQKGFQGWGHPDGACQNCHGQGETPRHGVCSRCGGTKVQKAGDEKLLKFLWENAHHTPFEMTGMTIEVQAPIFVFREWHRHRVPFGYNEMSARYAPLPDVNYIPTVERLMMQGGRNKQAQGTGVALTEDQAQTFRAMLFASYKDLEFQYQSALDAGVPKELARIILPVGRYSRMMATGNLRGWLAFLKLRQAPNAQYEIRVYAEAVHDMLAERFPRTLALFDEGTSKTL